MGRMCVLGCDVEYILIESKVFEKQLLGNNLRNSFDQFPDYMSIKL